MKVGIYAVYDQASGIYDGPVPQKTDNAAMRGFLDLAHNDQSVISKHPSDFSLWRIGTYDDSTGEIEVAPKKCLAYAIDMITPKEDD